MYYFANPGVLIFRWLCVHTKIKCIGVRLPFYGVTKFFFFQIFNLFSANEKRPELHSILFSVSSLFYFGCLIILFLTLNLLCMSS
jgi:hypothetical protein